MKTKNFSDLAILGGRPTFPKQLYVGRPNIGNRERLMARINDMLDRKWLTNHGPFVQEFEEKIARHVGVKHCIAMANGTIALEIAIRAVGLSGEVIMPAFTFVATAHALQWQEITPVFCDINPSTYTIDPIQIHRLITPKTTGIIGVHLWGRACDVDALTAIAERHKLKLLFDAAHALGTTYHGQSIGKFGDAEIFSFHATKFVNSFEGGAIVTNNDELAAKARLMKNFGFQGYDNVGYIGTNGKMSEIAAAMGLTSLESIDEFTRVNKRNYELYKIHLSDIPGISLIEYPEDETSNYQYIVIDVDETQAHITRDQLITILHAENVLARRYFYPGCHRMEPYRSYYPNASLLLPQTEKIIHRIVSLPTGTSIGEGEIMKIAEIIRLVVAHSAQISYQTISMPVFRPVS